MVPGYVLFGAVPAERVGMLPMVPRPLSLGASSLGFLSLDSERSLPPDWLSSFLGAMCCSELAWLPWGLLVLWAAHPRGAVIVKEGRPLPSPGQHGVGDDVVNGPPKKGARTKVGQDKACQKQPKGQEQPRQRRRRYGHQKQHRPKAQHCSGYEG